MSRRIKSDLNRAAASVLPPFKMSAYNPHRGDVKIALGENEFVLRPSFSAIVALEEHFGCGIFDLAREFCEGKRARAKDLLHIMKAGIEGAGFDPPEDLPQRMVDAGLASCIEPIGKFLAHACGIKT